MSGSNEYFLCPGVTKEEYWAREKGIFFNKLNA